MRSTPAVITGITGQTLTLRYPSQMGKPTAATFSVFRGYGSDDSTPDFVGTATVDPPNTATSAACGEAQADPTLISLASVTGILTGRRYVLVGASGIREDVNVIEVGANYVRAREPLQADYLTGATFYSPWLTMAVDNTWILDISKLSDLTDTFPDWRVKWLITNASGNDIRYSYFDVVRAIVAHNVEIDDVNARAPGLSDSMPVEYRQEDGRPLVDAAWKAVRAHLQSLELDINGMREDEALDEMVVLRSLRVLAEGGWHPKGIDWLSYAQLVTNNYDRYIEQHFAAALKHRFDYGYGSFSTDPNPDKRQIRPAIWSK